MKRVFIGIMASRKIKEQVLEWEQDKLNWPVRWVKPDYLHLTLIPPFYKKEIKELVDQLGPVTDFIEPFKVKYKLISYGPKPRNYRLIWARGEPSQELVELKQKIEKQFGVKESSGKLLPHLTLARFKQKDFCRLKDKDLHIQINWKEEIKSFELIEAILLPQGAKYTILKSFPLC